MTDVPSRFARWAREFDSLILFEPGGKNSQRVFLSDLQDLDPRTIGFVFEGDPDWDQDIRPSLLDECMAVAAMYPTRITPPPSWGVWSENDDNETD